MEHGTEGWDRGTSSAQLHATLHQISLLYYDPKIQLYNLLKGEIEPKLNDPNIVLDSFIISNTPYEEISFWNPCEDKSVFKKNHIVFQMEKEYISELFGMIL